MGALGKEKENAHKERVPSPNFCVQLLRAHLSIDVADITIIFFPLSPILPICIPQSTYLFVYFADFYTPHTPFFVSTDQPVYLRFFNACLFLIEFEYRANTK